MLPTKRNTKNTTSFSSFKVRTVCSAQFDRSAMFRLTLVCTASRLFYSFLRQVSQITVQIFINILDK